MFEGLEPKITWIDSSHCKVTFPYPENVGKAIEQNMDRSSMEE